MQYGSAELRIKETKDKTKRAGMDISFLALVVILLAIGVTMVLSASFARAYFDPAELQRKGDLLFYKAIYFRRSWCCGDDNMLATAGRLLQALFDAGSHSGGHPAHACPDNRNERKRSKTLDRPRGIHDPARRKLPRSE